MAAEAVTCQQTEQLETTTQVTNETAVNVGRTVFELLAESLEAHEPTLAYGTQTLQPTHSVTGQPPHVGIDRDSEPDSVLDQ